MEKKVLKFFNKYKIDPNGKDMTALEEKIFDIPISEFTDEILEYVGNAVHFINYREAVLEKV